MPLIVKTNLKSTEENEKKIFNLLLALPKKFIGLAVEKGTTIAIVINDDIFADGVVRSQSKFTEFKNHLAKYDRDISIVEVQPVIFLSKNCVQFASLLRDQIKNMMLGKPSQKISQVYNIANAYINNVTSKSKQHYQNKLIEKQKELQETIQNLKNRNKSKNDPFQSNIHSGFNSGFDSPFMSNNNNNNYDDEPSFGISPSSMFNKNISNNNNNYNDEPSFGISPSSMFNKNISNNNNNYDDEPVFGRNSRLMSGNNNSRVGSRDFDSFESSISLNTEINNEQIIFDAVTSKEKEQADQISTIEKESILRNLYDFLKDAFRGRNDTLSVEECLKNYFGFSLSKTIESKEIEVEQKDVGIVITLQKLTPPGRFVNRNNNAVHENLTVDANLFNISFLDQVKLIIPKIQTPVMLSYANNSLSFTVSYKIDPVLLKNALEIVVKFALFQSTLASEYFIRNITYAKTFEKKQQNTNEEEKNTDDNNNNNNSSHATQTKPASFSTGSPITSSGDAHNNLVKDLTKIIGDEKQFKGLLDSVNSHQYSQALRRACTCQDYNLALKLAMTILKYTKELHIDIDQSAGGENLTAIHYAAKNGNAGLFNYLESVGANKFLRDSKGISADEYMFNWIKASLKGVKI